MSDNEYDIISNSIKAVNNAYVRASFNEYVELVFTSELIIGIRLTCIDLASLVLAQALQRVSNLDRRCELHVLSVQCS